MLNPSAGVFVCNWGGTVFWTRSLQFDEQYYAAAIIERVVLHNVLIWFPLLHVVTMPPPRHQCNIGRSLLIRRVIEIRGQMFWGCFALQLSRIRSRCFVGVVDDERDAAHVTLPLDQQITRPRPVPSLETPAPTLIYLILNKAALDLRPLLWQSWPELYTFQGHPRPVQR